MKCERYLELIELWKQEIDSDSKWRSSLNSEESTFVDELDLLDVLVWDSSLGFETLALFGGEWPDEVKRCIQEMYR